MFRYLPLLALALSSASAADFKKDIQPILKAQCYKCHSEEAKKEKGGFVFDNLERFAKDIGPGRIIEPGKVADSHFYETLVVPLDDDAHMPPKKQMAEADVKKFKEWIEAGASLDGKPTAAKPASMLPERPAAPVTPAAAATPAAPATMQDWTNTDGRVIQATMLRMEGANVVLQMANGQVYNYPMEKLSAASQEMAKRGGK